MTLGSRRRCSHRLRCMEGVPMHEFRTTTQNLSPAVIEHDAAMRSGLLRPRAYSGGASATSSTQSNAVTRIRRKAGQIRRSMLQSRRTVAASPRPRCQEAPTRLAGPWHRVEGTLSSSLVTAAVYR
jgi:hypothetical protein